MEYLNSKLAETSTSDTLFCSLNDESCERRRHEIRSQVSDIVKFLNIFRWISDSYVSDFFVYGHWEKLQPCWQSHLKNMAPTELVAILDSTSQTFSSVWPLSLLSYRKCIEKFSLDRKMINIDISTPLSEKPESAPPDKHKEIRMTSEIGAVDQSGRYCRKESQNNTEGKAEFFCGQYQELYHIYRRHVKPKKQHEIHQLAQVIKKLADCCHCEQIVDIGAGLGHLSRLLTFGFGLKVTTVEATDCHAPKAVKYDKEMEREIKKKKGKTSNPTSEPGILVVAQTDDLSLPSHVTHWIEPTVSMAQFLSVVKPEHQYGDAKRAMNAKCTSIDGERSQARRSHTGCEIQSCHGIADLGRGSGVKPEEQRKRQFQEDVQGEIMPKANFLSRETTAIRPSFRSSQELNCANTLNTFEEKFVLCGLHACGNLTSTMLRLFVTSPQIVGLSSVGCCYMKLTCDSSLQDEDVGYPMSETVRSLRDHELSYAAREMACHFIDSYIDRLKENRPNLIVHSYRAALQQIILEKHSSFQRGCHKITVKKAEQMTFQRYAEIGLKKAGVDPHLSEAQLATARGQISQWRDVVVFYTLRLALAPVIETLILLDRQLYVMENGINSILLPAFDPSVSPRNFVLLAKKS